jgi:hypothetical protein
VETYTLPNGEVIRIPAGLSPTGRQSYIKAAIRHSERTKPTTSFGPTTGVQYEENPFLSMVPQRPQAERLPTREEEELRPPRTAAALAGGIPYEDQLVREAEKAGTTLGSSKEALESLLSLRGARQMGNLAAQGILGILTPGTDTKLEKKLRQGLAEIYKEVPEEYRESHLQNIGTGLTQVGALYGLAAIPGIGAPLAVLSAGLMGAGQQAGQLAQYEQRTGEDVSTGKEIKALLGGFGIGLSEMAPIGRMLGAGKKIHIPTLTKGKMFQSAVTQAAEEAAQESMAGFAQSWLAQKLYDEDALNNAGAEAIKEAIAGGEVGAVADVLQSMLLRGKWNRFRNNVDFEVAEELMTEYEAQAQAGTLQPGMFNKLVTGVDLDKIRNDKDLDDTERAKQLDIGERTNAFRDRMMEQPQWAEDYIRQQFEIDLDASREKRDKSVAEIQRLYKGKDKEAKLAEVEAIHQEKKRTIEAGTTEFLKEIAQMKAGMNRPGGNVDEVERNQVAQAELDDLEQVATPTDVQSRIDAFNARINELKPDDPQIAPLEQRREELQSQLDEINERQAPEGLSPITTEDLAPTPEELSPITTEDLAPSSVYTMQGVWEAITKHLPGASKMGGPQRPHDVESEVRVESVIPPEQLNPLKEDLSSLKSLKERVDEKSRNLQDNIDAESRELSRPLMPSGSRKAREFAERQAEAKTPEEFNKIRAEEVAERQRLAAKSEARAKSLAKKRPELQKELDAVRDTTNEAGETLRDNDWLSPRIDELTQIINSHNNPPESKINARIASWEANDDSPAVRAARIQKERKLTDEQTAEIEAQIAALDDMRRQDPKAEMPLMRVRELVDAIVGESHRQSALDGLMVVRETAPAGIALDKEGNDQPAPTDFAKDNVGILAESKWKDIFKTFRDSNLKVTQKFLRQVLKAKNYKVSSGFFGTNTFANIVESTLGKKYNKKWSSLTEMDKHAVLNRILQAETKADTTVEGRERLIRLRDLKREQDEGLLADLKSPKEKLIDLRNVEIMGRRLDFYFERLRKLLAESGIPASMMPTVQLSIESDRETLKGTIKDVVFNGVYKRDKDGKIQRDENGNRIMRVAFRGNNISAMTFNESTDNGGSSIRMMVNLSRFVERYGNLKTDAEIEQALRSEVLHEGLHLKWYRILTSAMKDALISFGKNKKNIVPREVNVEAHEAGMTWREYTASLYKDQPEYQNNEGGILDEETSVRILEALAKGQIPAAKSAGTIGVIKKAIVSRMKAIIGAAEESDIYSILAIHRDLQNRELMHKEDRRDSLVAMSKQLDLVGRANPDDLILLRQAIKDRDEQRIKEVASKILRSRYDAADTGQEGMTSSEAILTSLMNDFRARRDIQNTPTEVVRPVLSMQALDDGIVSPEALDAFFTTMDTQREYVAKPYVRQARWGKNIYIPTNREDQLVELIDGFVGDKNAEGNPVRSAGEQLVTAPYASTFDPSTGKERTGEELQKYIKHTVRERWRGWIADRRYVHARTAKRHLEKEIEQYKNAEGILAQHSSIAAFRFADNAMNYIPALMQNGPLSFVNGGFDQRPLYRDGRKVLGLMEILRPLIELDGGIVRKLGVIPSFKMKPGKAFKMAVGYVGAQKAQAALLNIGKAEAALEAAEAAGADLKEISDLRQDLEYHKMRYNNQINKIDPDTNERLIADGWIDPNATDDAGKPLLTKEERDAAGNPTVSPAGVAGQVYVASRDKMTRTLEMFENPDSRDEIINAVRTFSTQYADFNYYMVEFAWQTGLIGAKQRDFWQSMPFIPFYRDQGWEQSAPTENTQNDERQRQREEALNTTEGDRIRSLLSVVDKAAQGSNLPLDPEVVKSTVKNAQALIRDGMMAVAEGRAMRDETDLDTARKITTVPPELLLRIAYLKNSVATNPAEIAMEQQELVELEEQRDEFEKQRDEDLKSAKADGFTNFIIRVKATVQSTWIADAGMVKRRLGWDNLSDEEVQARIKRDESIVMGHEWSKVTTTEDHGVNNEYVLADPVATTSIMTLGISPIEKIENFFGAIPGLRDSEGRPRESVKMLAKLVVGSSGLLRETVTRSPIFQIKNVIRDSMQASVTFGGGVELIFKTLRNVVDPDIVRRAEQAGLGIAVDWSPDPKRSGEMTEKTIAKEQLQWNNPIDIFMIGWDALGRMSKHSEVATRMAVYDRVMAKTNGNAAQATLEAMEIINYGRRGSSPLLRVFTAMSPFMNGRIQGLDVMYRTHMGVYDQPGLFDPEKEFAVSLDDKRRRRILTTLVRGGVITSATLLYFLMMYDEEEYKNAREDQKNDWWLIPLGGGLKGVKIPTPFEVGLVYKFIPEQILRMLFEDEHDLGDVAKATQRQLTASLYFDLRPQVIRPILDAMFNNDAYQRGDVIVPQWMEESVAATEQFNPYTNMFARTIANLVDKVPFLSNVNFLTSPMKLEYMFRQYFGTIGAYGAVLADRIARESMDENIVGSAADFGFDDHTWTNMPLVGDLFWDPAKGGGYQEDFYALVEDITKLTTTLGQLEQRKDHGRAAAEYRERYSEHFKAKQRLDYMNRFMIKWRNQRDQLFERRDMDDDVKRAVLRTMIDQRDDMLVQMLDIMADVRGGGEIFKEALFDD